jgi:hypothetical protein
MKEKNTGTYYSKAHEELICELFANDKLKFKNVSDYGESPPDLIKEYKFEYASWPVIISNERVEEFTHILNDFKNICYKAILSFFKSKESFGDYLECPGFLFDFLGDIAKHLNDYVFRYDIIFLNDDFKILEVNAGSNVGGWQLDLISQNYLNLLNNEHFSKCWNVNKEDILENVFRMVIKSVKLLDAQNLGQNIVCVTEHEYQHNGMHHIRLELTRVFAKVKEELAYKGELIWCCSLSELYIDRKDYVYINGESVGAVMVQYAELEDSMQSTMMQLTKSYVKGNLVFPDSPFHKLLGNKNILSLLYDAIDENIFNQDEVDLIRKHVPWTHKCGGEYIYKNQTRYETSDFLKNNKDTLVLKKSISMKGEDVFVGKFMNESSWLSVSEKYVSNKQWLIQEYCKPDKSMMCDKSGWLGQYDFIWGIFDIDYRYSGSFIRGNRENCGDGVINSAGGAIEFSVFEEEKLKRVMSI